MDVYYYLVKNPGYHGVREIQREMNYSSPALASYHLNRLIKAKVISKSDEGTYGIIKDAVRLGGLDDHVEFISYWIPRTIYIATILFVISVLGILFYVLEFIASRAILVFSFVTLILSFVLLSDSYSMIYKLKAPEISDKSDKMAVIIQLQSKLSEAISLKQERRAKYKFQAQQILEEIVKQEVIDHELTLFAMFNLCEILLDELKTYGENEVLREFENLSKKVFELAKSKNTSSWIVDALLLQHKLDLIKGNLDEASVKLDNALQITKVENDEMLEKKVISERINFEKEIVKWETLTTEGASIINRIEQAGLVEYIQKAEIMKMELSTRELSRDQYA